MSEISSYPEHPVVDALKANKAAADRLRASINMVPDLTRKTEEVLNKGVTPPTEAPKTEVCSS